MDWVVTLFYLPAYLIGWGISIVIWWFILGFAWKAVQDIYDLVTTKKPSEEDKIEDYYQ
tara:strand:- start:2866 stop:3042 length:177 start_codon:yes stop_codon:yes gene_type:complete